MAKRNIFLCEEMVKFRNYLDEHKISWEDTSDIKSDEEIEKWISFGIEEAFADTSIYRTKFEYKGTTYTVINGYSTYGGYRQSTRFNEGLLEVRNWDADEVDGGYTASEVIELIFK